MEEIRTSIDIGAAAETVWDVLTDFADYSSWNPTIPKMKAEPQAGGKVDFTIVIEKMRLPIAACMVRFESGRGLCWVGPRVPVAGVFLRGEHYFQIEPTGTDQVRLVHGEQFSGILLPLLWQRMKPRIEQAYAAMNHAIKWRAEAIARDQKGAVRSTG